MSDQTRAALAAKYVALIGYDPFLDDPTITEEAVERMLKEYEEATREREERSLAIARKWVARFGLGFHPDTRGADYTPRLSRRDIHEYDADMETLFEVASDPYECGIMAMHDAGLI